MRQQFGLGLSRLREMGFQYLGDALVVLLTCAFEQGLSGCVLNQRMLKGLGCLGWYTSLVNDLCLDEPS